MGLGKKGPSVGPRDQQPKYPQAKALLYEIAVSCPRIADRPADPSWTQQPAAGPEPQDPLRRRPRRDSSRIIAIVLEFELTDFSRIVLPEPIVPGPCRSQATCHCGNALHYIELRYKLC